MIKVQFKFYSEIMQKLKKILSELIEEVLEEVVGEDGFVVMGKKLEVDKKFVKGKKVLGVIISGLNIFMDFRKVVSYFFLF